MLEQAKTRALPVLNRVPDLTPAAQACCGVCRGCMTTNIVTVAAGAVAAASYRIARRFRRIAKP
ncbi:MAG TPA: hypothetical protein VJT84_03135 [Gaiellaceae bacterium]|nr:hypothetical protein [Gaiellaceae bacterium]